MDNISYSNQTNSSNLGQLAGLQSLRGIACIIVVLQHSVSYFATTKIFRLLSEALFNSHAAVILFFILSGFVLVRSLERAPLTSKVLYIFYVRRIFRIYPALWSAVAFTALVLSIVKHLPLVPQTSQWFGAVFTADPSFLDFAKSIAGVGAVALPPLWTIRVEVIASLLLPLLAYLAAKGKAPIAIFTALLFAATPAIALTHHHSLYFLVDFSIGAALVPWASSQSGAKHHAIAPLVASISILILLFFRTVNPAWRFESGYEGITPDLIEAVAAGLLILVVSIAPHSLGFLRSKKIIFLGDISYSIYLFHFPIIVLVAKILGLFASAFLQLSPNLDAILLSALTLTFTIIISGITYKYIELEGIKISKRILRLSQP